MIYIKPYITIPNLLLFIVITLSLIRYILQIKHYMYPKPLKEGAIETYFVYIDKYYVSNIIYTIICSVIYISMQLSMLLLFRYYLLGTSSPLYNVQQLSLISLCYLIIIVVLFVLALVLFYYIFEILFFDEIVKLFLYLNRTFFVSTVYSKITTTFLHDFIGPVYLFVDNIAQLNLELTDENYDWHYMHMEIYDNIILRQIHNKGVYLCQKYCIIHFMFIIAHKFLRLLYVHGRIETLAYLLPCIFLFCSLFHDVIILNKLYYTYIMLFILSIMRLFYKAFYFIYLHDGLYSWYLYRYFYSNNIPYEKMRPFICNSNEVGFESEEKAWIQETLANDSFRDYVLNNLQSNYGGDSDVSRKINWMYIRFSIIIMGLITAFYLVVHYTEYSIYVYEIKLPTMMVIIPTLAMYHMHINTFKKPQDAVAGEGLASYVYNRNFGLAFWSLAFLQGFIYWILLF